jgi:MoxR-like ATPase
MQEQKVTIAGQTYSLPRPFHVLATQNPLEQEGTYPLPEAQLDRFLMQIDVGYPDRQAEKTMLLATTGLGQNMPGKLLNQRDLLIAQQVVRALPISENVLEGILTLVRHGRPTDTPLEKIRQHVAWGPGPRAGQALMLACRARALLDGRLAPSLDDVVALAGPVLQHRMALNFAARADGVALPDVIEILTGQLG